MGSPGPVHGKEIRDLSIDGLQYSNLLKVIGFFRAPFISPFLHGRIFFSYPRRGISESITDDALG